MSENKLDFAAVYEPRVNLNNERIWAVLKGGQMVNTIRVPTSTYSNSFITFEIQPPSKQAVLDRVVIAHMPVTITLTATNSGVNNILQSGRFALRAFPLSSVTESLSATFNGANTSIPLRRVAHILSRFRKDADYLRTFGTIAPCMEDKYQDYEDGDGAVNNPLASYSDNSFQPTRGSYMLNTTTTVNGLTTATIGVDLYEYITIPPYLFDGKEAGGLTGLDTVTISFALSNNLPHILSMNLPALTAAGITITGVTVNFIPTPELLLTWITPRETQPIPPIITYPYAQVNLYPMSTNNVIAAGASMTIASVAKSFQNMPDKLYIYAQHSDFDVNASLYNQLYSSDTFAKINSVSINFNNTSGLLSSAHPASLYEISYQNGLNTSWQEFTGRTVKVPNTGAITFPGTTGSILCISPTKDLGLQSYLADGVSGQFDFSLTLNVTNTSKYQYPFDLVVIAIFGGTMTITSNSTIFNIGRVTREDVLNAREMDMNYNQIESIYGTGNFLSNLGDIIKKGATYAKNNKLISRGLSSIPHPLAQLASQASKYLGLGTESIDEEDEGCGLAGNNAMNRNDFANVGSAIPAGLIDSARHYGNGLVGGREMTERNLKDRAVKFNKY